MPTLASLFDFSTRRRLEALRPRLCRLAHSWCHDGHLAEDLAQESLLKAMDRVGQLKDAALLESWTFTILNNVWRDHLRRRKTYVDIDDLDEAVIADAMTPEENAGQPRDAVVAQGPGLVPGKAGLERGACIGQRGVGLQGGLAGVVVGGLDVAQGLLNGAKSPPGLGLALIGQRSKPVVQRATPL